MTVAGRGVCFQYSNLSMPTLKLSRKRCIPSISCSMFRRSLERIHGWSVSTSSRLQHRREFCPRAGNHRLKSVRYFVARHSLQGGGLRGSRNRPPANRADSGSRGRSRSNHRGFRRSGQSRGPGRPVNVVETKATTSIRRRHDAQFISIPVATAAWRSMPSMRRTASYRVFAGSTSMLP